MRHIVTMFTAFLVAAVAFSSEDSRPARVDITTKPANAQIFINGESYGVTPMTVNSLKAGKYHLRLNLQGYQQYDEFFTVTEGSYVPIETELVAETGILLVTSDPEGADLSLDGVSLGVTPKLVTDIKLKRQYRFELAKTGYGTKKFDVRLENRVPAVRNIQLMLDSGRLNITSTPVGADVYIGDVCRGKTPIEITMVPKGKARITLKMPGYADYKRVIDVMAGGIQSIDIPLTGLPGKAEFSTTVPHAKIKINGKVVGNGAVQVDLPAGEHEVEIDEPGYTKISEKFTIEHDKVLSKMFTLESQMGSLAITTLPGGASVFLDGKLVGRTKSGVDDETRSEVLVIEDIPEGEHEIRIERKGFKVAMRKPDISRGKRSQANFKLKRTFTPNVEIETLTKKVTGVYKGKSQQGVTIEEKPGVVRTYSQDQIKKVTWLNEGL